MFNEYRIFNGISEKQLETLLPCINGKIKVYPPGTELAEEGIGKNGNCTTLILGGKVSTRERMLSEGDVIGYGMEYEAPVSVSHVSLLTMEYSRIMAPCWFSCHFHWTLCENLKTCREETSAENNIASKEKTI